MIGIVGGGMAGLATAHYCQQAGRDVVIFEAADQLGGLAAVYETAGDPIEQYYHHLSKSEETIVELASDLGLGEAIEWRYKSDGYYVDGQVYPLDTPWEILAYPYLGFYDTFRLGLLTLGIDIRSGIPRFDSYDSLEAYEDVRVKDFILEHTTHRVYENFFEPLLRAKFGNRMHDVSAAWLLGRIKFRGERHPIKGEQLGYLEGGFHQLIQALVDDVGQENIETSTRVVDVDLGNGAIEQVTVESPSGRESFEVDELVIATMPNVLEDLTGYACSIDFQGTICSVISTPSSVMQPYWLNIADEAPFGVLIEHTNFIPTDRYGGEHLLYAASYIQDESDPLWQADNATVESRWLEGITDLFPSFDPGSINWIETVRNPRTAPVYSCGYLEDVIPYDLSTAVADGIYYAGMASRAQYPERSLNGAILAGKACARGIIDGSPEP